MPTTMSGTFVSVVRLMKAKPLPVASSEIR
jgi:hypothetical protein